MERPRPWRGRRATRTPSPPSPRRSRRHWRLPTHENPGVDRGRRRRSASSTSGTWAWRWGVGRRARAVAAARGIVGGCSVDADGGGLGGAGLSATKASIPILTRRFLARVRVLPRSPAPRTAVRSPPLIEHAVTGDRRVDLAWRCRAVPPAAGDHRRVLAYQSRAIAAFMSSINSLWPRCCALSFDAIRYSLRGVGSNCGALIEREKCSPQARACVVGRGRRASLRRSARSASCQREAKGMFTATVLALPNN